MIEIEEPNISTVNMSEDGKSGKFIVDRLKEAMVQLSETL